MPAFRFGWLVFSFTAEPIFPKQCNGVDLIGLDFIRKNKCGKEKYFG